MTKPQISNTRNTYKNTDKYTLIDTQTYRDDKKKVFFRPYFSNLDNERCCGHPKITTVQIDWE